MTARDVVITGIGLVSCLGEGIAAHWDAFSSGKVAPVLDTERFKPHSVHPLPVIDWNLQIPKRGDQRQMEQWQRLGTYTAGLALDDAGLKGNEALCASMDMIVAAGGGERDIDVDVAILEASLTRSDREVLINEKLTTDLRPTLFLAQLSNLLAGNISIVHKVTGSSRTFMGEEGSGVAAVATAAARIRAGQSTHALVGGAFQTEHPDHLLAYQLGGHLHHGPWAPLWRRQGLPGGGVVTGSGAAFLVLESQEHADNRGHRSYAAIGPVASGKARRDRGELEGAIRALVAGLGGGDAPRLVLSAASGAHQATAAEQAALGAPGQFALRAFSGVIGHLKEGQFPFAVALAALAVANEKAIPPIDPEHEASFDGMPEAVIATAIGFDRFEGAGLIFRA